MNGDQQVHPGSKMNGLERTDVQTTLFEKLFCLISVHLS